MRLMKYESNWVTRFVITVEINLNTAVSIMSIRDYSYLGDACHDRSDEISRSLVVIAVADNIKKTWKIDR